MTDTATALTAIYRIFEEWSSDQPWACSRGCSSCCTQNVSITALEGRRIIAVLHQENRLEWLKGKLTQAKLNPDRPRYTFNVMARACLKGKSLAEEEVNRQQGACPLLEENCCSIYPVRPLSCRTFLSLATCTPTKPAMVKEVNLTAATALAQIIEHLDQGQPWGNMLDMLNLLLADKNERDTYRSHLLRSQPLPGFLFGHNEYRQIAPLLDTIFSSRIGKRTIEEILNRHQGSEQKTGM